MCADCVLSSPRIAQADPGRWPLLEGVLSRNVKQKEYAVSVNRSDTASTTLEMSNTNVGHHNWHCNVMPMSDRWCHPSDTENGSTIVGQDDTRKTDTTWTKSSVGFSDINGTDTINESISVIQDDIVKIDTI
jgi:hypothetical protein